MDLWIIQLQIKSRWGRDLPHPSPGTHPASCTMGTGSWPGRGIDHPAHLAQKLKKE